MRGRVRWSCWLLVLACSMPARAQDSSEPEQSEEPAASTPSNPFEAVGKDAVESSLSRALHQKEAAFCQAYRPGRQDHELCELSKLAGRQRCPALARACEQAAKSKPEAQREPEREQRAPASTEPARGSALGDALFWVVLIGLAVGLAIALLRLLGTAQLPIRSEQPRERPLDSVEPRIPPAPRESDVARLWTLAQERARVGRFEEALAALQAALIHSLRLAGKLHVSPALTHGDYLRALRGEPELQSAAREVFRSIEAVEFGGALATGQTFQRLFARVLPIVQRSLLALCLLATAIGTSACSAVQEYGSNGATHGHAVLTRLLSDNGTTVRQRIRPLGAFEPELHVILVEGEQSPETWDWLIEFVDEGGTLVVAATDERLEKTTQVHFERHAHAGKLDVGSELNAPPLELFAVTDMALRLPPDNKPGLVTLASADGHPFVVQQYFGDGSVLFFADPAFLGNASLSVADNAWFVTALLARRGGLFELVGPWTSDGSQSTLGSLKQAGLGTVMAQLALVAVLFAWFGGVAFGARRDPIHAHRRAFRDHVLALAENYRRVRATRFALATYGGWLIERLRERVSPQQPLGLIDLAGRLAPRVELSEPELVLLLTEVHGARDELAGARPDATDLEKLQRLESLAVRVGGSK